MNVCVISGNLGADCDVFYSSGGVPVCSFNIAFRSNRNKTNWLKIVCFNKLAEACEAYLSKGSRVLVTGSLQQDKWETEQGETRTTYKMIAHSVEFIKIKKTDVEEGQEGEDIPF